MGMILQPLLSVYLPRTVVLAVNEGWNITRLALNASLFTFGLIVCNLLSTYGTSGYREYCSHGRYHMQALWQRMLITCRYEHLEDPRWKKKINDAEQAVYSDWSTFGLTGFTLSFFLIVGSILGITTFAAILRKMHGTVLLVLAGTAIVTGLLDIKTEEWEYKKREKWLPYNLKMNYVYGDTTTEKAGKDLRVYNAQNYYLEKYHTARNNRNFLVQKVLKKKLGIKAIDTLMLMIQNGVALGWLVYETVQGTISIVEFTLYASSVVQFTQFVNQFMQWIGVLKRSTLDIQKIRDGLAYMPEEEQIDAGLLKRSGVIMGEQPTHLGAAPHIRFENVSFQYPGADRKILDNVSFEIHAGEKIALVGENGAGKTTIVKLLCGLYQPTSGKIFINDQSIDKLSDSVRAAMIGVVFQDLLVLPFTVLENVTIGREEDVGRARHCLELAGLSDRFPNLNVNLVRGSAEEAENLSGGEQQKLLLARVLYKDAPILILDEPTAALDPLAESELYEKYCELTENKTGVFISHRLASTRFCSRIILFGDGKVLETGSHDELVALDGQYAQMFREQSKYYLESWKGDALI